MAVTVTPGSDATAPSPITRGAPGWTIWLYLGGLALVFAGERVFAAMEKGAGAFTAVGLFAVLAATALRFTPRFRVGGERRSIESLLAALSVTGLVGLLVYFLTEGAFSEKLGIDALPVERRDAIREISRVVWVSLIVISSVPMVFVETALRPMVRSERPESRRVRAAAGAGLSLALAAVYCSLIVYAASGIDLRVDYSYFRTSRPSDSTRKYIENMSEPLRVVAFFPDVNEVKTEVAAYLRDLATASPKLKLEIHDRLLVPKLAKELRVTQDGTLVLSRGTQTQTLAVGTELDSARPKLKTLDRDFQEQLVKILNPRRTAYLTVGHGELNDSGRGGSAADAGRSARIVRELIQRQNFTLRDLGLAQGLAKDVPEDANIVISLGPTEPFSREELAALERYAERGGKLILAPDADAFSSRDLVSGGEERPPGPSATAPAGTAPTAATSAAPGSPAAGASTAPPAASAAPVATTPAPPGSAGVPAPAANAGAGPGSNAGQELAEVVGLSFSPEPLANEKNFVPVRYNPSDHLCIVTNSFSSHASVSTLSRNSGRAAVVLFGAGSLDKGKLAGNAKVEFPLRSMSGTFQDKNRNFNQDSGEKTATYNLAAAVSRPVSEAPPAPDKKDEKKAEKGDKKDEKKEPHEMRAFVLADADGLSDLVMGRVVGNQILFVDGFRWLVGEESVQGLPNTEEDKRIEHTKQVDMNWFYATIFGVPGLVLGLGLFISRKSRGGGKR